jgi:hypothetical protein
MRGLTARTATAHHDGVLARRRGTSLPKLALLLLAVVIIRGRGAALVRRPKRTG